MPVNPRRVRTLYQAEEEKGPVVYWMSRNQRVNDNWALTYAQELADEHDSALAVAFCLTPKFLGATSRHYHFMLQGLKEVEKRLQDLNIPFFLMQGDPGHEIPDLLIKLEAGSLVCDFSPLRQSREWKSAVATEIRLPFYEVDAHNIIPCWFASPKQEWAAYSFRPKVHRLRFEFLEEHARDRREYLYGVEELERGKTHDDLWNAAQLEIVQRGKMHGYMRMYWAKKILEWTESPAEALRAVIYLNDRYELDGRDPNGYAGAAWSLGGLHDRAWKERAIYGKVRYMSYNGSKRKFDVQAYIDTWKSDVLPIV